MIGNGEPWGNLGYVIVEEGDLDPVTFQLNVRHYLVVKPDGEPVSGTFSLREARDFIEQSELNSNKK